MSDIAIPEEVVVGRGDPVYMAHGYLTKVPVPAILPFIQHYSRPGDLVVDPFAGSGMTGVAAAIAGRRARLFDVSVLGKHIADNYLNLVPPDVLRSNASKVVADTEERLPGLYTVPCASCGRSARLVKTVWSIRIRCRQCSELVNYYRALERAHWSKASVVCPSCEALLSGGSDRVGEEPVQEIVSCVCATHQLEQSPNVPRVSVPLADLAYPRVDISPDRVMYQAQSLGKSGLTTVASFYSERNLAALTILRQKIADVVDDACRRKLLFAFTASLTRASKRYQWSQKRPLNAANANYYVAPIFYEWNVYDLFLRKVDAAIRSDEWLVNERQRTMACDTRDSDVSYQVCSAEEIPLPDASVEYVFTDPPFGSNLFYADMALFQEAWLGEFTDVTKEAVIKRGAARRESARRYEATLTMALSECRRILKPGGHVSMVFGNSTGSVWSLVQRAIAGAKLVVEPEALVVLNKGQRSVKGLASGFEHVATLDLVITMRSQRVDEELGEYRPAPEWSEVTQKVVSASGVTTPSHFYLELLRMGFREGWDLSTLDLRTVTGSLVAAGWEVDEKSGRSRRIDDSTRSLEDEIAMSEGSGQAELNLAPLADFEQSPSSSGR